MELVAQTMTATISQGSLSVPRGHELTFEGTIDGTVDLSPGSTFRLQGVHRGRLTVPAGATLEISAGGVHEGVLVVDGVVRNAGTRGGSWTGTGAVVDLEGSVVR